MGLQSCYQLGSPVGTNFWRNPDPRHGMFDMKQVEISMKTQSEAPPGCIGGLHEGLTGTGRVWSRDLACTVALQGE